MFQFPAFAPALLPVCRLHLHGFPHSDMCGSIPVCESPHLFAAYHVLRRRQKPRHPPFALIHFLWMNLFVSFCLEIAVYTPTRKLSRIVFIQTLISFASRNPFARIPNLVISLNIVNDLCPFLKGTAKIHTFLESANIFQKKIQLFSRKTTLRRRVKVYSE